MHLTLRFDIYVVGYINVLDIKGIMYLYNYFSLDHIELYSHSFLLRDQIKVFKNKN